LAKRGRREPTKAKPWKASRCPGGAGGGGKRSLAKPGEARRGGGGYPRPPGKYPSPRPKGGGLAKRGRRETEQCEAWTVSRSPGGAGGGGKRSRQERSGRENVGIPQVSAKRQQRVPEVFPGRGENGGEAEEGEGGTPAPLENPKALPPPGRGGGQGGGGRGTHGKRAGKGGARSAEDTAREAITSAKTSAKRISRN